MQNQNTEWWLSDLIAQNVFPANSYNGCLEMWGKLHIDVDYTFSGVVALMMRKAEIIVDAGVTLTVTDGNYWGCDERLWQGFTVIVAAEWF